MNLIFKKYLKMILKLYPNIDILIQKAKLLKDTKNINLLKYIKNSIKTYLSNLNLEDKEIIKYLFFKHGQFTAVYVSLKLHVSRATVYNHINKFLNQLSLLIPLRLAKHVVNSLDN